MRDINAISALGIPIDTQPGYRGGVSIPSAYKFGQSFFSPEEIADIVLALHLIGNFRQKDAKSSILQKLELLLPELTILKEQDFTEYLQIELFQEPLIKKERLFQEINGALEEEIIVEPEIKERNYCVAPLSYALRASGLYLYASDGERLFDFPLAEIKDCRMTGQSFERQAYQKLYQRKGR